MDPKNQTDHIAILSLMLVGVLTKRLVELGQIDETTSKHLHQLVKTVGAHAKASEIEDLTSLFESIDKSLG